MEEAVRIWREKSDEELLEAGANLGEYTEEGQRVIRDELRRRGFEDPVEQARFLGSDAAIPTGDREADGTRPTPDCLRCEAPMQFLGARKFHEGTRWGAIGEIGHLFEKIEAFDVYACLRCGHVEFFVSGGDAEK